MLHFPRVIKIMHTCAFMYVAGYALNLAVGEPMNDHGSPVFPVELDFCGIKFCNSWEGVLGYLLYFWQISPLYLKQLNYAKIQGCSFASSYVQNKSSFIKGLLLIC